MGVGHGSFMRGASRNIKRSGIESVLLKRVRELVQRAALLARALAIDRLSNVLTLPEIGCAHFQLERPAVALRHEAVLKEKRDVLEHLTEVQVTCLKLAIVIIASKNIITHIKF